MADGFFLMTYVGLRLNYLVTEEVPNRTDFYLFNRQLLNPKVMDDVVLMRQKDLLCFRETFCLELWCNSGNSNGSLWQVATRISKHRPFIHPVSAKHLHVADPVLGTGTLPQPKWTTFLPAGHLHSSWGWAENGASFQLLGYLAWITHNFIHYLPTFFCRLNLDFTYPLTSEMSELLCDVTPVQFV